MNVKFRPDPNNVKKFLYEIGVVESDQQISCVGDDGESYDYALDDLIAMFEMNMVDTFNNTLKEYDEKIKEVLEEMDIMYDVKDQKVN